MPTAFTQWKQKVTIHKKTPIQKFFPPVYSSPKIKTSQFINISLIFLYCFPFFSRTLSKLIMVVV